MATNSISRQKNGKRGQNVCSRCGAPVEVNKDLLAALRAVMDWQNDEELFSAANAARAAIAHATGTETPVRG